LNWDYNKYCENGRHYTVLFVLAQESIIALLWQVLGEFSVKAAKTSWLNVVENTGKCPISRQSTTKMWQIDRVNFHGCHTQLICGSWNLCSQWSTQNYS